MEWLNDAWDLITQLVHPATIIRVGGPALLFAVVFAETGLMFGFFLPGDSLLFTAGLLTATGVFPYPFYVTLLVIFLAAWLGDQLGYYIGYKGGPKVFNRKESLLFKPEYVKTTKDFYERYGSKALMLGHWLPIIRTFAPIFAGVAVLPYRKFVVYTGIGSALWATVLVSAGYFLGNVPGVEENLHWIILGMIVFTTIPVVRTILKEQKNRKAREAQEQAAEAAAASTQPEPMQKEGQQ